MCDEHSKTTPFSNGKTRRKDEMKPWIEHFYLPYSGISCGEHITRYEVVF